MRFNILLLLLAVVALFAVTKAQTDCGPPQCYFPCTNAKPAVDFVFLIDVSGSMANPINGVKSGLTQFVNNLSTNITASFSLAYFGGSNSGGTPSNNNYGGAGHLVLNHVSSAQSFITQMGNMVSIASNNLSPYAGGVEPGLETIMSALQASNADNMGISYNSGYNTKKVFIVVTNEDSDPPVVPANLFKTSSGKETGGGTVNGVDYQNGHCLNDGKSYTACGYSMSTLSTNEWTAYQAEINAAATTLINNAVSVYMFVAGSQSISQTSSCKGDVAGAQSCLTRYQYCDPDAQSQNSDYTNFNSAATLTLINNAGIGNNLQGQLLTAGQQMRCFDVHATGNAQYVDNFFSQIVADLSQCHTTCYDYICTSPTTCAPPINQCGCDGVKYSGKVPDGYGNCCWANQTDCSGRCGTAYKYDPCGVCTLGGANSTYCKSDCAGNSYISAVPTGYNYTIPSTFDAAGYLLMNPDIVTAYENTWKNVAAISQHFHDYGMFEGRSYCTFDLSYFNSQNHKSYGTQADGEAAWLASLLTSTKLSAQCVAGSQRRYPPLPKDSCNQCIINAASPPYCVQDCAGTWRTSTTAAQASFIDNCGYCVAYNVDPNAHKDSCGVCDGGNASKNQCGVCGGTKALDACGQPACNNTPCNVDCDGVHRNPLTHHLNDCGTCVLNGVTDGNSSPKCLQDCAGTWYNQTTPSTPAPHHTDECGNCVPLGTTRLPTCVPDCAGNYTGTAYLDKCGQCVNFGKTPYTCLVDCNGTYYTSNHNAPNQLDDCGTCLPPTSPLWDGLKDRCGICTNAQGYNSAADCTPDCKGVYNLTSSTNRAFNDICGTCWFANQSSQANSEMDACGRCPHDTGYGTGSGITDTQGAVCPCGATPKNCTVSGSITTCGDSCPYFCPGTDGVLPNSCGFCPNDPGYQTANQGGNKDKCGVCCNSTAVPNLCNTEIDSCGVCFGFDTWKNNPCKICDQYYGTKNAICKQDCSGTWGGNKTVGCDGICGSHAVCSICGDGKVEAGEDCDLGSKNGKNLNTAGSGCNKCKAETGALGAAIGGAIGGVAAIVALALAAFFAFRYAQKNGLIGSANKQVDFGASNTNPLYKSEVAVHQNPLYETS